MTATDFADYLTRKGVYSFNIHDIRKYAGEFDQSDRHLAALNHLRETAKDARFLPISDEDFDLATGRPLKMPE